MALPPVPSMVATAMATLMTGKTILMEDSALLPTKRETKIPSTIVYSDINIIIMIDGAANFNRDQGVNRWLSDELIKRKAPFRDVLLDI